MVVGIICFVIAIIAFVIAVLQFMEKGFLFNNAYLWASKEERKRMDKKSHYKQSGVVFLLIGIIFLLNAIQVLCGADWIFPVVIVVVVGTILYAIVSSVMIEKKK